MSAPIKSGPLTAADLEVVWAGAVDAGYRDPLIAAGDGGGMEIYRQHFAQLERVSAAVDRTTQGLFLKPWSGQTNEPAGGEQNATVLLTFTRTLSMERVLWIEAGTTYVDQLEIDWGETEGVEVETGLRFLVTQDVVFQPGDQGPITVSAVAEQPGYAYNDCRPGTIVSVDQVAAGFENVGATLAAGPAPYTTVSTPNRPDTFVPSHVGSYVQFLAGSNTNKVGRVRQFLPPNLALLPPVGSYAVLDLMLAVDATTFAGTPVLGETFTGAGGTYKLLAVATAGGIRKATFRVLTFTAPVAAGGVLTGAGGATLTVRSLLQQDAWTAEAGTAQWRVLPWSTGCGLLVTNAARPAGGRSGMLDMLGDEKNLPRHPGEDDAAYRKRLSEPADVVSPSAVRRALYRVLGALPWCLSEAGEGALEGFFYDGDGSLPSAVAGRAVCDGYDVYCGIFTSTTLSAVPGDEFRVTDAAGTITYATGMLVRSTGGNTVNTIGFRMGGASVPATGRLFNLRTSVSVAYSAFTLYDNGRSHTMYMSFEQFRGYFKVCLPRVGAGEWGVAFDTGLDNAFDVPAASAPLAVSAFDGGAPGDLDINGRVWRALEEVHAGGVGYEIETGCTCT